MKLIIATLDFSRDVHSRVILSKILTASDKVRESERERKGGTGKGEREGGGKGGERGGGGREAGREGGRGRMEVGTGEI